jgi:adenylylsulfate kinase-like enzyme
MHRVALWKFIVFHTVASPEIARSRRNLQGETKEPNFAEVFVECSCSIEHSERRISKKQITTLFTIWLFGGGAAKQ